MSQFKRSTPLPSNSIAAGTAGQADDYIFDDSGLPNDLQYLGPLSISAATSSAGVVAGDPVTLVYGKVALQDIGNSYGFTLLGSATGTASGFAAKPNEISWGIRQAGGASSLVFFVRTSDNVKTLSGSVDLGVVI
jgi:hypothetical protein